ncbi:MAG: threonine synthase [Acidobacteria bacterium]|nr:threonine synthase [Acidobacteriota bacterium]
MSSYRAVFRCSAGCPGEYSIWRPIYHCPTCGDLLQVEHDLAALRDRSPATWMRLFDDRYKRTSWPYGSGVWGKKEWVCPELRDDNVVSMDEGGTNLFWAERLGEQYGLDDLWVKMCGNSHTGSFKDLGMTVLASVVKQMMADGAGIRAVACASTGDTSASLAAYAAAAGIPAIVILPRGLVTPAQLVQPIANGAKVLALDTDFDGCMKIVTRLAEEEGVYLANSMNSLRLEGQKTLSFEIVQQFDWQVPDLIVIPGGNLGNVSALGAGFDMLIDLGVTTKRPRIVVAQAEAANPLYLAYKNNWEFTPIVAAPTMASAIRIGNPVSIRKAIRTLRRYDGIVEQASETELADAAARGDLTGLFNCPHTGVALAALEKLLARGEVKSTDRVIVISTANGLKFTDFKVEYHTGLPPGRFANPPLELPNDYDRVRHAVDMLTGAAAAARS